MTIMKYKNQFIVFCIIILILNLRNIIVSNRSTFSSRYTLVMSGHSYSLLAYSYMIVGFLIFIWSIIWLFIIYKKALPKFLYLMPGFYIFYYFFWALVFTTLIGLVLKHYYPLLEPIQIIDMISRFDILFYLSNMVIAIITVYKILVGKTNNKKSLPIQDCSTTRKIFYTCAFKIKHNG